MTTATLAPPSFAFTAQDRCDRCGARAAFAVKFTAPTPLLFCIHHFRKHQSVMTSPQWIQGSPGTQ